MEFSRHKAIFEQIAELMCKRIIDGNYPEGERIPSVRELASMLQVNPNTVVASYNILSNENIIQTQRGIGYSASQGSLKLAKKYLEKNIMQEDLKRVLKELKELNISEEEILEIYRKL